MSAGLGQNNLIYCRVVDVLRCPGDGIQMQRMNQTLIDCFVRIVLQTLKVWERSCLYQIKLRERYEIPVNVGHLCQHNGQLSEVAGSIPVTFQIKQTILIAQAPGLSNRKVTNAS